MIDLSKELDKRRMLDNRQSLNLINCKYDFCSNDYLGLSKSEALKSEITKGISESEIKSGSGAARLLGGNYKFLDELENKIANFHNFKSALLFSNGYLANLALYSSIASRNDTIFYDEKCHTSIKDGIRLSYAKAYSFKHNDLNDLSKKIKLARGDIYIAVESVYSMDGDFALLNDLVSFCKENSISLIVDEAHSNGIYGKNGQGRLFEMGLEKNVFAAIMTYGKAFGVQGAAILGDTNLKEYLINFSRPFIYSTAISPILALMIDKAYDFIFAADNERLKLFSKINYFNENIKESSYYSPIKVIQIKGNTEAKAKAEFLQAKGYDIRAILSPTIKKGEERLRICLHSFNTEEDILNLIKLIYA